MSAIRNKLIEMLNELPEENGDGNWRLTRIPARSRRLY